MNSLDYIIVGFYAVMLIGIATYISRTKKGEKKVKQVDIDNFVGIKNWKAIGNKLIGYARLSGFKLISSKAESNIETKENNNKKIDDESIELTLF